MMRLGIAPQDWTALLEALQAELPDPVFRIVERILNRFATQYL